MIRRALGIALLVFFSAAPPAAARDIYKAFLDPAIPHHKAILDTLEKLQKSPKDAGLHNDLGCLIARDGFWRDALREFDQAARLAPKDSRPFFNAGLVRAWKGEWAAAGRTFHKAVGRDPGNWSAWWMLGYTKEMRDDIPGAIEAYKTSLRVDTSLFDVAENPFAASSRLRTRVLLETFEKRRVHAAQPLREQLADAARVGSFFQKAKPPAPEVAEAAPTPVPTEEPTASGPVVSVSPSAAAPPPRPGAQPGDGRLRTAPPRGGVPQERIYGADGKPVPTPHPPGTAKTPVPGPGGDFPYP